MQLKSSKTIEERLSYNKKGIKYIPLKFWILTNGQHISIYQGSRGQNPDLDFVIKYLETGKKLRGPSHTHWIVDLILKCESHPYAVKDFVDEWLHIYDLLQPFQNIEERNNYNLIYNNYFSEKYSDLENLGKFSVEFLSIIIELFIRCEKQTDNAFMFKNLLNMMAEYCDGKKDFYQVISYSKRT